VGADVISSILVANRGEIARRVMRTARRLGVRTIAVFSDADAAAAHVRDADISVRIGGSAARESYLRPDAILSAARETGAEAVHPGYGFLAENAEFAEAVMAAGLVWIGPPPAAIRAMGLKDSAKRLMRDAGVPVTPGYLGEDQDPGRLLSEATAIGWPVLIKPVAGGGGKGMRKVTGASDFPEALAGARREAASAFGDDRVLLETFVSQPRHLEVQVFADAHGQVVHLFERDCSVQRRHQKVIEEAPAPGMDPATREALCAAAVRAARAVHYQGAGTVEFIADASNGLAAERIWFMEMNTRLQVEHPVTEAITGVDLVEWQIRVAGGETLPLPQEQIRLSGHAVEARLYAEDPGNGFLPSTGALTWFGLPPDIRVDSSAEPGDVVSPYYDPMIAKLISHAASREMAVASLAQACRDVRVWPVKTNAWFLARCLTDGDFIAGGVDTSFVDAKLTELAAPPEPTLRAVGAVAAALAFRDQAAFPSGADEPWSRGLFGFRLNAAARSAARLHHEREAVDAVLSAAGENKVWVEIGGQRLLAEVAAAGALSVDGAIYHGYDTGDGGHVIFEAGAAFSFSRYAAGEADAQGGGDGTILAPMPGRIVSVAKTVGAAVRTGEIVLTLEAMKMEYALKAPFDGILVEVHVREGEQVAEQAVLARLEPAS
jgi:acetyl/propionyl-CoA carboxylase alpha subunit